MLRLGQLVAGAEVIIWDWNGTLLDDSLTCVNIVNEFLSERGLEEMDLEKYRQVFNFPVEQYYRNIGLYESAEQYEELGKRFMSSYRQAFPKMGLHKGSVALLHELKAQGLKQYVLSASQKGELVKQLTHFDLMDVFEDYQGLDHFKADCKKEAGKQLLDRAGIKPEKAILVGDTTHDADVAKALGLRKTILLPHGHHSSVRLKEVEAELVYL